MLTCCVRPGRVCIWFCQQKEKRTVQCACSEQEGLQHEARVQRSHSPSWSSPPTQAFPLLLSQAEEGRAPGWGVASWLIYMQKVPSKAWQLQDHRKVDRVSLWGQVVPGTGCCGRKTWLLRNSVPPCALGFPRRRELMSWPCTWHQTQTDTTSLSCPPWTLISPHRTPYHTLGSCWPPKHWGAGKGGLPSTSPA